MGKRKSKRKPVVKKKLRLDTSFPCLFCNHKDSVTVKIDTANKIGNLSCQICSVAFQTKINRKWRCTGAVERRSVRLLM